MRKNTYPALFIALLAIATAAFFYKRYHVPPVVDIPAISLTDLQGHKVSLQAYSGHPLFISFFATWCGPCIREIPELIDLRDQLSDKHLQLICISDEPVEKLQRVQSQMGAGLVILRSEHSLHNINIYTYPTNYIYDAGGKKIYGQVNPDNWTDPVLVDKIKTLLK